MCSSVSVMKIASAAETLRPASGTYIGSCFGGPHRLLQRFPSASWPVFERPVLAGTLPSNTPSSSCFIAKTTTPPKSTANNSQISDKARRQRLKDGNWLYAR